MQTFFITLVAFGQYALVPCAPFTSYILTTLLLYGEWLFNQKVANFLMTEWLPNVKKSVKTFPYAICFLLALCNAIGNGAIAANGGPMAFAVMGSILSLLVMQDPILTLSKPQSSTTQNQYNGSICAVCATALGCTLNFMPLATWLHIPVMLARTIGAVTCISLIYNAESFCFTICKPRPAADMASTTGKSPIAEHPTLKPFFSSILQP